MQRWGTWVYTQHQPPTSPPPHTHTAPHRHPRPPNPAPPTHPPIPPPPYPYTQYDLLLTALAFSMGGISAVTSLMGMNLENIVWADDPSSYWAFVTIASVMSAVAVGVLAFLLLYMRRRKMLNI